MQFARFSFARSGSLFAIALVLFFASGIRGFRAASAAVVINEQCAGTACGYADLSSRHW